MSEITANPSSSSIDCAPGLINKGFGETLFTKETKFGSEVGLEDNYRQYPNKTINDNPVFKDESEQKAVIKIESVESLEESHSSIPSSVTNNSVLQSGFISNTEKQRFCSPGENIKTVLQPIVYDNERNCSLGVLNLTQSHYSQQFQNIQHSFQPQSLPHFTIYNQILPNIFQEHQNVLNSSKIHSNSFQTIQNNSQLYTDSNQKYSNAFQLIQNSFQPHVNNYQPFTNDIYKCYLNAHHLHPSAAQSNPKGNQTLLNDKQLPTVISQSCPRDNQSLPNDFHQHPKYSFLNANQSSSIVNKSQSHGNSLFSGVSEVPQPSINNKELLSDPLENDKLTFLDVIAPLEKYFQGNTCLLCGFKSSAKWPCRARQHLVTHLHKRDFKCGICGKGFVTPEYQLEHEKTHTKDLTYPCQICESKFSTRSGLSRHEKTHEGLKFECSFCKMQLATQSSLKNHLTIHTGELPYQCSTCTERFRTSLSLGLHMSKHTGKKKFTCNVCNKEFNGKGLYKQHLGTHKGEAAFECDQCGKKFNFRSNLAQHQRVHSEDRTHECGNCGKKFKFPHHLRSHAATHSPTIKTE